MVRPNSMTASEDSVLLITKISENIRNKGCYLLADRRIELIFNHAQGQRLKMDRLRSFAHLHHWQVEIRHHGHSALFYPHP
jgi:hypothetical protein